MRKIYKTKLVSLAKQSILAIALTVFATTANAQATYTFNYTGSTQTLNLQAGSYDIEIWGADGGGTTGTNINAAIVKLGGKGGYAKGTLTVSAPSTASIYVGGKGSTEGLYALGGFNGGGNSGGGSTGVCGGGGGASDIRVGGNTFADRKIVAGGGGAAGYQECNGAANVISGGHGGALTGGAPPPFSYANRIGQGGTQTAGGAGGTDATYVTGSPGSFGLGGNGGITTVASAAGAGGGGGWYGGGAGANGFYCAGGGGGGSSYIGGVTSGTTIMFGQAGFVNNPDVTGNGLVIIKELCSISLVASTANSLNPSICSGQSLTLTTNAVSNYSWSTGATTSSLVVSPTINTVYSLSATSPSNCNSSANITVVVSGGQPTLSVVSSTNQTCLGKTATLTASGAVTYTWTNGVTNGISFFPQSTNTYTVTGENGCGTVTAVSTITVSPLALSVVSSNSVVCTNKTATLAATAAATSYTWQPGNIIGASPNLIINPQANTNYTITATDGTCVGVANVSVNADPVPTIQIASSATTACPGDVVTFTASGGSNYTWTANNQTGTTLSTSLSTTTLITVQGDNQFGCISNTSQVVSVQTAPTINVATASPSICSGSSSTLNVTGANSYTWTGGSNGNSFVVNPSQTTVYSVDGSNTGNPCISTKTLEITVFTPSLTITGNTTICDGETSNLTAGSATSYTWAHTPSFPGANVGVTPNVTTTYTVNATHEFNGGQIKCPISGNVQVVVNPIPTVSVVPTRMAMCAKETNTLTGSGASTYTWVSTSTTVAAPDLTINPTSATILNYTLNGTSSLGCEGNTVYLLNVSACTGIEESNTSNSFVNIYPNPSQGNFTIETGKEIQLKLINQLGQVIEVIQLNEKNNYKTSLSNLSNGVYFISGDDLNKKIIVNK